MIRLGRLGSVILIPRPVVDCQLERTRIGFNAG